jgi:uncharacterized membrane protein YciS (DUF1049 family)
MNNGQQLGLGMNLLGLVLFAIWLVIRHHISTPLSIIFTMIFLALLCASLFVLIRSTLQSQKALEQTTRQNKQS